MPNRFLLAVPRATKLATADHGPLPGSEVRAALLNPVVIRRFDRAGIFAPAADDDDAPASRLALGFFRTPFIYSNHPERPEGKDARGSAALHGICTTQTGKQGRRLSFDASSPALPDGECPAPGDPAAHPPFSTPLAEVARTLYRPSWLLMP
jgi:hypothetical protein